NLALADNVHFLDDLEQGLPIPYVRGKFEVLRTHVLQCETHSAIVIDASGRVHRLEIKNDSEYTFISYPMKHDVKFRIIVTDPLPGVSMQVQRGKNELLPPTKNGSSLIFDFEITVDLSNGSPNFLGKYAQGPK